MNSYQQFQNNVDIFFEQVLNKNKEKMKCKSGCSQCCHAKFSVFAWEASVIIDYFESLSDQEKTDLIQKWSCQKSDSVCSFLVDDQCTIYSSRPIICRTQGLPLFIDDKMDSCPLNFEDALPSKNDWLDLDRLNTLSTILNKQFLKDIKVNFPTVLMDNNSRVSLDQLQIYLKKTYEARGFVC